MEPNSYLPDLFRRTLMPIDGSTFDIDLQRQMDRLFEEFSSRLVELRASNGNGNGEFRPALDMTETDDSVDMSVELPGIDPKDIDVTVSGHSLIIRGEKKCEKQTKEKDYWRAERSYGSFNRTLTLPFEIDASKVDAKIDKGLLRIHIAKPAGAKTEQKKIPVCAAG